MNERPKKAPHSPKKESNMVSQSKLETEIVMQNDSEVEAAYCVLPPHFFDRARSLALSGERVRPLLSISTWDGRSIMEVARKF